LLLLLAQILLALLHETHKLRKSTTKSGAGNCCGTCFPCTPLESALRHSPPRPPHPTPYATPFRVLSIRYDARVAYTVVRTGERDYLQQDCEEKTTSLQKAKQVRFIRDVVARLILRLYLFTVSKRFVLVCKHFQGGGTKRYRRSQSWLSGGRWRWGDRDSCQQRRGQLGGGVCVRARACGCFGGFHRRALHHVSRRRRESLGKREAVGIGNEGGESKSAFIFKPGMCGQVQSPLVFPARSSFYLLSWQLGFY
jgi:hypothetical protein